MLEIKCDDYFKKVAEFAEKKGLKDKFEKQVNYLRTYGDKDQTGRFKVILNKDFAPASFSVSWFMKNAQGEYEFFCNGGMIYHGDQSGWDESGQYVDPLNVQLVATENPWVIST